MKHYLVVTDTNSRQWYIQFPENGLSVELADGNTLVFTDTQQPLHNLLTYHGKFIIGGTQLFNSLFLVAIEYKAIPDDAM
jgi:hypothetical protein